MRKAPTIVLLIVSLLWNTFAMAQPALVAEHGDEVAHVLAHLENEPHHHHGDGDFHQDSSGESVQHVYADGCANVPGFIPVQAYPSFSHAGSAVRQARAFLAHDSPILEGPKRPPRSAA